MSKNQTRKINIMNIDDRMMKSNIRFAFLCCHFWTSENITWKENERM